MVQEGQWDQVDQSRRALHQFRQNPVCLLGQKVQEDLEVQKDLFLQRFQVDLMVQRVLRKIMFVLLQFDNLMCMCITYKDSMTSILLKI